MNFVFSLLYSSEDNVIWVNGKTQSTLSVIIHKKLKLKTNARNDEKKNHIIL